MPATKGSGGHAASQTALRHECSRVRCAACDRVQTKKLRSDQSHPPKLESDTLGRSKVLELHSISLKLLANITSVGAVISACFTEA